MSTIEELDNQIHKLKTDHKFLTLKRKARLATEKPRYEKMLRAIATLEKKRDVLAKQQGTTFRKPNSTRRTPTTSTKKVESKPVWRNQPKTIAWRNQDANKSVLNDTVRDEEYDRNYNERVINSDSNIIKKNGRNVVKVPPSRVPRLPATAEEQKFLNAQRRAVQKQKEYSKKSQQAASIRNANAGIRPRTRQPSIKTTPKKTKSVVREMVGIWKPSDQPRPNRSRSRQTASQVAAARRHGVGQKTGGVKVIPSSKVIDEPTTKTDVKVFPRQPRSKVKSIVETRKPVRVPTPEPSEDSEEFESGSFTDDSLDENFDDSVEDLDALEFSE